MDLLTFDTLPPYLQQVLFTRELAVGQRLFRQGDSTYAVFVVETGRLRLVRSTIEDKVVPLQFITSGQSVGDAALFNPSYSYTAIAEVASTVLVYLKQELMTALRENPDLAEDVIAILLRKIQAFEVNLELKGIKSAQQRILRYLQYLTTPEQVNVVQIDRPWKEIADELGFTPDTLSRALARLEREGSISRLQQQITLHNISAA